MIDPEAAFKKLNKPPSAPNWVRYNHLDVEKTASAIASFVLGIPKISYQTGLSAVRDRIELGIDLRTAVRAVSIKGMPAARKANEEFVRAFFEYDNVRCYSGRKGFDGYTDFFQISRDIAIPVTPTSIIAEKGKLVPLFIFGWASVPLTLFQRRLMMTIYEEAVFSLTDFQNSPAEVLFLPKDIDGTRTPEVWTRGDYNLLSGDELEHQVRVFLESRDMAKQIIEQKIAEDRKRNGVVDMGSVAPSIDPRQSDLFKK